MECVVTDHCPGELICNPQVHECQVCFDDAHCQDPAAPRCDVEAQECRCFEDQDCWDPDDPTLERTMYCDPESRRCELRDDRCLHDDDCVTGVCDPETNQCVGCLGDGDCDDGFRCVDNRCAAGCRRDQDCQDGYCVDGACVACREDGHCPRGQICDDNQCHDGCRSSRDCPWGQPCVEGQCRECERDEDCSFGPFPVGDNRICEDYQCRPGCREDDQCPRGVCDPETSTCVECLGNDHCPEGSRCVEGRCLDECRTDEDCGSVSMCLVTEGSDRGLCVECEDDSDCDGGVCQEDHFCIHCARHGDCPEGMFCDVATQLCIQRVPNQGLCATCASDDDCGGEGDLCVLHLGDWGEVLERFCGTNCDPRDDACPDGYYCARIGRRGYNCIPSVIDLGGTCNAIRHIGDDCRGDDECGIRGEARCVQSRCTVICDPGAPNQCPDGMSCQPYEGLGVCSEG